MYRAAMYIFFGCVFLGLAGCNGNKVKSSNASYTGFDSSAPVEVDSGASARPF